MSIKQEFYFCNLVTHFFYTYLHKIKFYELIIKLDIYTSLYIVEVKSAPWTAALQYNPKVQATSTSGF